MVLEWLLRARSDRKHPLVIFIFTTLVTLIAMFISYFIFKETTGIFTIVLISLVLVSFINSMFLLEEKETEEIGQAQNFVQRHGDIIAAFAAMFVGMTIAMSLMFILLPEGVSQQVFDAQIKEVKLIQGKFTFSNQFMEIFVNNLSVLSLSFLLSFLLGTGAILILAWNASVLSAAIGMVAKSLGGISGLPIAILTFLPHGSFEITAYFIGAIGGGLVSVATVKKNSKFWYIFKDSIILFIVSIILLVIGGLIETVILMT